MAFLWQIAGNDLKFLNALIFEYKISDNLISMSYDNFMTFFINLQI